MHIYITYYAFFSYLFTSCFKLRLYQCNNFAVISCKLFCNRQNKL